MADTSVAIRDYLKQKGYTDKDIAFNNLDKAVYLKGQEFYKPDLIQNGQSYGTAQTLDAALAKLNPVNTQTQQQLPQVNQQPTQQPEQVNYGNAINGLVQQMLQNIQQPKTPEPFNYTPETDPAYQAALRTALTNAGSAQNDTLAKLRSMGQGKSSYSETLANQIRQKEVGKVTDQALPQLLSQAYTRYRDQISDQQTGYNNLLSGLGTIADLQQRDTDNERNAWQDRFNYGQAIGQFANGQKTAQAQQMEQNQKQYEEEKAYKEARDAIADERYKAEFDQDVQRYGLEQAAKRAYENQQLSISAMNAATSRMNAEQGQSNAEYNRLMDQWQLTGIAPNGLGKYGVKPGTVWPKEGTATEIPDKQSAANYNYYQNQLQTEIKNLSYSQALQYAESVADELSDKDYRALLKFIQDNQSEFFSGF